MNTPLYKLYRTRPKQPWLDFTNAQRMDLFRQDSDAQKELGIQNILMCDAWWSTEHWGVFGVQLYPSAGAVFEYASRRMNMGWLGLVEPEVFWGTSSMQVAMPQDPTSGLYKLVFFRLTGDGYNLDEADWVVMQEKLDQSLADNRVTRVADGHLLSNEHWQYYALEHYPSMEQVITHRRRMNEMGWFQYVEADVLLGTWMDFE